VGSAADTASTPLHGGISGRLLQQQLNCVQMLVQQSIKLPASFLWQSSVLLLSTA
jgi:hypothetical protein